MATYPAKFGFDPEWSVLEDPLRDALKHDHEGLVPVPNGSGIDTLLALLEQRDRQLADYLSSLSTDVPYQFPGTALSTGTTAPYTPATNITVGGFSVTLTPLSGLTPTGTFTIVLQKNATTIATVTLTGGSLYGAVALNPRITFRGRLDVMTVSLTAIGTNGASLGGGIEVGPA